MENDSGSKTLAVIQRVSLVLTGLFAAAGFVLRGTDFTLSVLLGAFLVNGSFLLLKRDARQILDRVAASDPQSVGAVQKMERVRFVFKFYARLVILGLLLYAASTRMRLDMIGVAVGLSTVMLSVILVVLMRGGKTTSIQRARGV